MEKIKELNSKVRQLNALLRKYRQHIRGVDAQLMSLEKGLKKRLVSTQRQRKRIKPTQSWPSEAITTHVADNITLLETLVNTVSKVRATGTTSAAVASAMAPPPEEPVAQRDHEHESEHESGHEHEEDDADE